MKYLICSILLALTAHIVSAQSPSPEVVASAGESFSSSNINLDWTLGELMIESYTGPIVLTQGFHQPALQTTSIEDFATDLGPIKVYPNPTSGILSIEKEKSGELQMVVLDIQGRIVLNNHTSDALSQIDLSHLPSGMYVLRMSDGKTATKSIRIQKL